MPGVRQCDLDRLRRVAGAIERVRHQGCVDGTGGIVDVESTERAYAIAAKASAAPGPGGVPLIIPIEVRQVMQSPMQDL